MPRLTETETNAFLAERGHLARIGTVDADGMPRVVPLWFVVEGDELLFTPRSPAVVWANIVRDSRVGISIDEEAAPWRKVTVQGHVVVLLRIVTEIERLLSIADELVGEASRNLTRCARLRQSILKWAFEGRLADQDPTRARGALRTTLSVLHKALGKSGLGPLPTEK